MTGMSARAPYDAPARPDASMSLLTNLIEHSLDEGYAEAAARRAAGEAPPSRPGWMLAAGLVMIGLLLATAALQVRDRAPSAAQARDALTGEIEQRTAAADRLETDLQELRESVATAREDALGLTSTGSELAATLTGLEVVTGAGAVQGPGARHPPRGLRRRRHRGTAPTHARGRAAPRAGSPTVTCRRS